MSNVLIGESSDMYDPVTGRWLGVIDRNGREQFVPSYIDDGNGNIKSFPILGSFAVTSSDIANATDQDAVAISASSIVKSQRGTLKKMTVFAGSGLVLTLYDGADSSIAATKLVTYSSLSVGDEVNFGRGIEFMDGLFASMTGTGTIKFEVM